MKIIPTAFAALAASSQQLKNVAAKRVQSPKQPTMAPTDSEASKPLSILIETYLDSASGSKHPHRIISPQVSADGNTAYLTLTGADADEPFYPAVDDARCRYCNTTFFKDSAAISDGTFAMEEGEYRATISGPPKPGLYNLVWKNEAKDKEVILEVEVACSDGIHCNGEERFVRDTCVPGYSIESGNGMTPYFFGPQNEQIHECYESAPWASAIAINSVEGECGPVCIPKVRFLNIGKKSK